jgi:hypothetical protein
MSGRNSVSRSARPRQVYLLGCRELAMDVDCGCSLTLFIVGNLGRVAFDEEAVRPHTRRPFTRPRFDVGVW